MLCRVFGVERGGKGLRTRAVQNFTNWQDRCCDALSGPTRLVESEEMRRESSGRIHIPIVASHLAGRNGSLDQSRASWKKRREEGAIAVVFAAAGLCLTDRLLGDRGAATPIFLPSA